MPKIIHIFKTYFPDTQGGLEEAIRQIGKISIESGFDVSVVSVSKNPLNKYLDKIKVRSFKKTFDVLSNPFSIDLYTEMPSIIKEADIIHLHFPWPTIELYTIIKKINKPVMVTFHCDTEKNYILKYFYSFFASKFLQKVDVIVPTSNNLMNNTKLLKKHLHKCEVIHLWLDESRFKKKLEPSDEVLKKINNIKSYGLFVGVLRWYKGLHVLLDAAKELEQDIVIVGKGPMYSELIKRIRDEKINNIHLMGYLKDRDVQYLISKTQFTVLPSISPAEAFGQILIESMFFKKACISTSLGTGTDFVNLHGKTGFVVEPNDSVMLKDAMNKLFHNPKLTLHYGLNGYNRYLKYFSKISQSNKYIRIYKRLIS